MFIRINKISSISGTAAAGVILNAGSAFDGLLSQCAIPAGTQATRLLSYNEAIAGATSYARSQTAFDVAMVTRTGAYANGLINSISVIVQLAAAGQATLVVPSRIQPASYSIGITYQDSSGSIRYLQLGTQAPGVSVTWPLNGLVQTGAFSVVCNPINLQTTNPSLAITGNQGRYTWGTQIDAVADISYTPPPENNGGFAPLVVFAPVKGTTFDLGDIYGLNAPAASPPFFTPFSMNAQASATGSMVVYDIDSNATVITASGSDNVNVALYSNITLLGTYKAYNSLQLSCNPTYVPVAPQAVFLIPAP